MKVRYAINPGVPGGYSYIEPAQSIADAVYTFGEYISHDESGATLDIFYRHCDELLARYEIGPRGGIRRIKN